MGEPEPETSSAIADLLLNAAAAFARHEPHPQPLLARLAGRLADLPAEAAESVAEALAAGGPRGRGAAAFLQAAHRWMDDGRWDRAAAACLRAARLEPGLDGLHHAWGLSLLALGDAEGARGHLERWRETAPVEALVPRIWLVQALRAAGYERRASDEVQAIALRRGSTDSSRAAELARDLEQHTAGSLSEEHLEALRPFWRDVAWIAGLLGDPPPGLRAVGGATGASGRGPHRILVDPELRFGGVAATRLLEEAGLAPEAFDRSRGVSIEGGDTPATLLVMRLGTGGTSLTELERLRHRPDLRGLPILAVAVPAEIDAERPRLATLGVVGIVDPSASPEHVLFRVNAVVQPRQGRRRFERVPTCFPVELESDDEWTSEYALNLSLGGMSLTSLRPLTTNTDVCLRLHLPFAEGELPELRGRVVWTKPGFEKTRRSMLGLFFYPLAGRALQLIEAEIARLLDSA
jgi:hypothetical protein